MRGTSRKGSKPQTEWVLGKSSTANGRATGREAETPGRQGRAKWSGNGMASLSGAQRTDGDAGRSHEHDRIRRISRTTDLPRGLSCSLNGRVWQEYVFVQQHSAVPFIKIGHS
jgi:hypothetical protein